METYLNVFEAWAAAGKSSQWCNTNGISAATLSAADQLLKKVHRALDDIHMPIKSFRGNGQQRTAAIMRSLAAGFYLQAAVASEPGNPRKPFWLMEDYAVNPTSADLHMGCVLRTRMGVEYVIFLQRSTKPDGSPLLMCVSCVESDWLVEAANFDLKAVAGMKGVLQQADRSTVHLIHSNLQVGLRLQCTHEVRRHTVQA